MVLIKKKIKYMKKIIIDLDGTLTIDTDVEYSKKLPNFDVIDACKKYKKMGFEIIISTSRNMRTYEGNVGKINVNTLPTIIEWLNKHEVPYDEVYIGKPWCGFDGFYVDDKAIRPSEFVENSYDDILNFLSKEKLLIDGTDA